MNYKNELRKFPQTFKTLGIKNVYLKFYLLDEFFEQKLDGSNRLRKS
ncbi:hypothetical protein CCAND93_350023 [Capnocytophaga canis]|uniref:Uncharacterized protein n=1 Tax=Capnocytophaga canis TaxID=1848903 RepID=A0A0B7ISP1_9FLAO|nr:hypothetical protein CCAND93_350023 [Capnocytophaga canis]